MISAWWLLLAPIVGCLGLMCGSALATKGHADECSDCEYNYKLYSKNKEESN